MTKYYLFSGDYCEGDENFGFNGYRSTYNTLGAAKKAAEDNEWAQIVNIRDMKICLEMQDDGTWAE